MVVLGARPQFVKAAPVICELASKHSHLILNIVHSGQHYDREMSTIFFRELKIPEPSANLAVGSGSHAAQTSAIMIRLESQLIKFKPDIVLVVGDTNTTLAAALTAVKLQFSVAHLEAGLRSRDMTMPEEVNRILTDHCSQILFAPTRTARSNLRKEGLEKRAYLTGDTNMDALHSVLPVIKKITRTVLQKFNLTPQQYVLVTLHRPSNVDDLKRLRFIQDALDKLANTQPVVFLVHPRTRIQLAKLGSSSRKSSERLILAPPQGYIETLTLLRSASCLLTDSGGMQKESYLLRTPCVTMRTSTEWPETLAAGANRLAPHPENACNLVASIVSDNKLRKRLMHLPNPFGDGRASERIVRIILQNCSKDSS